jgi:protein TonB
VSVWSEQPSGINRAGEFALWGGAGLVVLAAHVGAMLFIMRQPPIEAGDSAPPPAIMIEMAAEPEAVKTEENVITPDEAAAEEVKSEMTEPVEEPVPEEVPVPPEPVVEPAPVEPPPPEPVQPIVEEPPPEVPPPVQEVVEPTPEPPPEPPPEIVEPIDPIEQQMTAALENVEVPLPAMRPPPTPEEKKPEPKKEPKKPVVQKPKPQPKQAQASKAAEEAQAQVRQADRTAASRSANGSSAPSVSPARWQSRLMAHLERRKRYPADARARREEGTAYVRFRIDDSGNVLSVALSRSSGSSALDQEVLAMVQRASPVPAPPAGVNKTIVAPVLFSIR